MAGVKWLGLSVARVKWLGAWTDQYNLTAHGIMIIVMLIFFAMHSYGVGN